MFNVSKDLILSEFGHFLNEAQVLNAVLVEASQCFPLKHIVLRPGLELFLLDMVEVKAV